MFACASLLDSSLHLFSPNLPFPLFACLQRPPLPHRPPLRRLSRYAHSPTYSLAPLLTLASADEMYGPLIVCFLIFAAVLANFIIRVKHREELRDHRSPKSPWLTTVDLVRVALNLQQPEGIL
jgi:hypothetical protein